MGDRGRDSVSELAVVPLSKTDRPKPPAELTPEQAEEWKNIVNRLPAEWFPKETHGLLIQYCRHMDASNKVASLITSMESNADFDIDEYDKLLKMQEREGRALSSLATRMRITQQATYDPKKKKGSSGHKPWED